MQKLYKSTAEITTEAGEKANRRNDELYCTSLIATYHCVLNGKIQRIENRKQGYKSYS